MELGWRRGNWIECGAFVPPSHASSGAVLSSYHVTSNVSVRLGLIFIGILSD